jgi:chorismate mutase
MSRNRITPCSPSILRALIWMAMLPVLAHPQDTSASKPATTQAAPTTPQTSPTSSSAPDPGQAPTSAQPPVPAVQAPAKKKPKKVWTNDELKSVKTGVSVVGDSDKGSSHDYTVREDGADYDSQDLHQQQLENYRNQIQQLRTQIDAIDKRIAQLKDFRADNTSASGGIKMHQGYNMVPLEEQVKQLESKKKELQANIEDVENEARKNGIEPGELR